MSVDVATQTDSYITRELQMSQIVLLEEIQRKWWRTFPVFSPLNQLRIDLGLTTAAQERESYNKEFRPAFGDMDDQTKQVNEEIYDAVEKEWNDRQVTQEEPTKRQRREFVLEREETTTCEFC